MISFRAKMFNASTGQYMEDTPFQYTIGDYYGCLDDQGIDLMEGHSGTVVTNISPSYFEASRGSNIGTWFEYYAKKYMDTAGGWPKLQLKTAENYILEWDHASPNSLVIKLPNKEYTWSSVLQWSDSFNPDYTDDRKYNLMYSIVFIRASNLSLLLRSPDALYCGGYSFTGDSFSVLVGYKPPVVDVEVENANYLKQAAVALGSRVSQGQTISYTKSTNKKSICVWRTLSSTYTSPLLIAPSVDGRNPLDGWDVLFTPNSESYPSSGRLPEYPDVSWLYTGKGEQYSSFETSLPTYTASGGSSWPLMTTILSDAGIKVIYGFKDLYDYIAAPSDDPVPPSDVDPDNPPDPDEPPSPIPPDDPDPYYDPTSDPDSPEYDPTKDPDSPEYDPTDPKDPYRPPSTEGGGDPPVKPPENPVTPPPAPPSHAINSRFVTLYTPSLSQLNDLAAYLWSPAWSIDGFKKIFANPMDCILGLMIFPALVAPSGSKEVNVGNLSTGVTMSYIDNQYVEVNCGSFEITEYYASYLDYDPYTKIEIYLPYIGTHRLSADDVMAKTIQLKYMIDLLSGACVAFLVVDGTTLYTFTGSCATPIPVSGNDWSNMVNGILSVAGAAAAAVISGGTAATMAAGAAASTSLFVSSHKEHIRHGGSVASAAGLMSIQTPYLIVTRPRQALPIGQNSFQGYPSFMTESLGSLTGYTEVESCHLEHIPCTDEELKEIERLLKGGVLF